MNAHDNLPVRVRFAPSPTGYLHIGGARTVLFNWLLARRCSGTFVLRIEDTDQNRNVADSVGKILDDLRWLGLTWDEGPEVGGDYGPYFQSERLNLYNTYLDQLLEAGQAYYALETPEELTALREQAKANKTAFKYPRPSPLPSVEQGRAARDAGQPVVVRYKMPAEDISISDEVLGDVTILAAQLEDFVIQKSDGFPTYHFACVVDDELMKITYVLRGQEHLMNTPKHIALQQALGFSTPHYVHLPLIFNMNGSKMGKRDKEKAIKKGLVPPEIDVHDFRLAGYLPEAVINFISLLGWSTGDDREQIDRDEMVSLFSIDRIGKTNARFDRDKLVAFNTDWVARVDANRLLEAFRDYLKVNDSPLSSWHDDRLSHLLRACEGFRTFFDVTDKAVFLTTDDDQIEYDAKAVKKHLNKNDGAGYAMLETMIEALTPVDDWKAASLEKTIQQICEDQQVKLGQVAQPIRVAITGVAISPPIFDSLELLGQEKTLSRLRRCINHRVQ